jgi:Cu2+-exporting ATPase
MPDCENSSTGALVVHELPRRLRLRNPAFHEPAFDPAYQEALLHNVPGVSKVRFNTRAACVVVDYDGSPKCRQRVIACASNIPEAAYGPLTALAPPPDPVGTAAKGVVALLTHAIPKPFRPLVSWGLALPVLMEGAETLVSEGVRVPVLDGTAVGFSLLRRDYFTANSIVALLALGDYLEKLSENKTTGLLKSLLRPQVETVWVERDGREVEINLKDVLIGDHVVCGAGELVPVDGTVVSGDASVNLASITGESVPVHLSKGDEAVSGAVIEEGRLTIEARQVGSETSMARINRFLENSLRFKSGGQKKSDELADRLVPTTFGLGLLLFLLTRDVRRAAAVLTVDYSCAIKLANPVAVKSAMYTAAHSGVLLKGAQALESLARVETIVFDKTGTLTRGLLEITDIAPVNGMSPKGVLTLAAAAEEHYAHPVARAVVAEAKKQGLDLPPTGQVDFIVAHGVSAYVNGDRVLVGSRHFIEEDEGIDCAAADTRGRDLRQKGKSLLYVARNEALEGVIALRDALRPEAARVLSGLKALGVKKMVMLTGDHPDTAKAIAKHLPELDEVHWDLKPEDKAAIVKKLRAENGSLAFAGDGVNDAPALLTADVGICMPGGADLAREAAQVVLMQEDLSALETAVRISRRTQQTINRCFGASVGLNTVLLLLAAGGRLPPVMSAVLHNANTVGVLGYAALSGMRAPEKT